MTDNPHVTSHGEPDTTRNSDTVVMFLFVAGLSYLIFAPVMIAGLLNGSPLGITAAVGAVIGWLTSATWVTATTVNT